MLSAEGPKTLFDSAIRDKGIFGNLTLHETPNKKFIQFKVKKSF